MDLLAGAAFAWCAVYLLCATYFGILAASRLRAPKLETTGAGKSGRGQVEAQEDALFAGTCILMAGYALCQAMHFHALEPLAAATWSRRGKLIPPFATTLLVATTCLFADISPSRRAYLLAFGAGGTTLATVANAAGLLQDFSHLDARPLSLGSIHYVDVVFAPRPAMAFHEAFILAQVAIALACVVHAYLKGKKEALLALLGGLVAAGCVVNDALVTLGAHHRIFLSEHGFSAFAFGLSYSLLGRHARVSEELTVKGLELRRRAQKLRRAYEELRAAQEELVRREQLAVVGELAAVVSHEVRNPLAIIRNAVAGLRRPGVSADDHGTLLSILDEETERLNRLVGDLLRYSRPLHVERRPLELDALVARACELVPQQGNIKLEVVERTRPLPDVYGDPSLLRQVVDNLVQNACQAMPNGGVLTVRVAATHEEGTDGAAIEIADTGEGMDTQVRSRARTPFFTTRPGGTRLGLAICDRIATAHGGFLAIKSRSGEGTIVSVFLPAGRIEETPVRSSAPPPRHPLVTPPLGVAHAGRKPN